MLLIKTNDFPMAVVESLVVRSTAAVARLSAVPSITVFRGCNGLNWMSPFLALTGRSPDNRD